MKPPTDASDLLKRAHDDVDFVQHPQVLGRARARGAEDADAVSLIHIDARAVRLGQPEGAAQVGDVAFHAEDAFGNDEDLLVRRGQFSRHRSKWSMSL